MLGGPADSPPSITITRLDVDLDEHRARALIVTLTAAGHHAEANSVRVALEELLEL